MRKISEKPLFQGKWLGVREAIFELPDGQQSRWETVVKVREGLTVIALARLVPSNRFILLRQFRPAINTHVLGLPAGMTSKRQSLADEALRELREETGYTGRFIRMSPPLRQNSGLIDDLVFVIECEVDEYAPENLKPRPELESSEEIEVLLKTAAEVHELLASPPADTAIGAGVWYYFTALGRS